MKVLVYLAVLVAIGFGVAWFAFGMHPKVVVDKMMGATVNSQKSSDVMGAANRLKAVGQERFGEAQDVYDGKIEKDDPFVAK